MSSDDMLNKGVFDLRAVLAERLLPEETVDFYVDEDLGHQIERIESQIETIHNQLAVASINGDEELKNRAERAAAEAEEMLLKTRQAVAPYRATLRATTRRARHDLQSKALHKFPIRRDLLGNDDPQNEFERNHYIDQLIWATHLRSITSPDGAVQIFSGVDDIETIEGIMDGIPESAYRTINKAIDKLMDDGQQFEWAAQSEDFSSES